MTREARQVGAQGSAQGATQGAMQGATPGGVQASPRRVTSERLLMRPPCEEAPSGSASGRSRGLLTLRRPARPRWHDYTAFILTGGGARGALQVGALRALLEHGIRPDVVIGTSIGSWNGAWMAAMPTLEGVERLEALWRDVHTARVLLGHDGRIRSALALNGMLLYSAAQRIVRGGSSVYGDTGLRWLLTRCFGEQTFADLPIPLGVVAMDLTHGRRVVLHSGAVVPALLASSAIPGIFPPVHLGDAYYCDGSDTDDLSFEAAVALGARRIYVLAIDHDVEGDDYWGCAPAPVSSHPAPEEDQSGASSSTHGLRAHPLAAVLSRTVQVSSHYQLEQALQRLPIGIERHVIDLQTGNGAGILDFASIATWLADGYAQTTAYLRRGERQPEIGEHEAEAAAQIAQAWGAA